MGSIISNTDLRPLLGDIRIPKEHLERLQDYGPCELYVTPTNTVILTLPTRTMPISQFVEENWVSPAAYGNVRNVYLVEQLTDGTRTNLFVKSPERLFNKIHSSDFWWGGRSSGEEPLLIKNNPAVEEQAFWEAVFLLELAKNGIKAETPQAILITDPTEYRIIVKRIEGRGPTVRGPDPKELASLVRELGLIPIDLSYYNLIIDRDGYLNIIDTNRWYWPPHTDNFTQRVLEAIEQSSTEITPKPQF